MDITRIESGKLDITEEKFELRQLIQEIWMIGTKQAEAKKIDFVIEAEEELPKYLTGDVLHTKQVILNLISNAVKYTEEGRVTLEINASGDQIIFSVKDTGIGIRKEDMDTLFDMFTRVDMKRHRNIEGSGLGLTIAKELCEQMGGQIYAESIYGKGSRFTVCLPLKSTGEEKIGKWNFEESKKVSEDRKRFFAPKAKVLIVDDSQQNLQVLASLLQRTSMQLDKAGSGLECIEKVRSKKYHLIFLDYMMPEMDGITALRAIREKSNVPVILITAKSEDADKVLGLDIGADDYITKPFNPIEVLARVRSQLRRYNKLGGSEDSNKKEVLSCGGVTLDDRTKQVTMDGEEVSLTPTEYEILKFLMSHPKQVFSPRQIYSEVWKDTPIGSEGTVAVHIRHLREKLEIEPSDPRHFKVVWGQGYKFE